MMEHDPQIRVHIEELLSFFQIGTSNVDVDSQISPEIISSTSSTPSSPSISEGALPPLLEALPSLLEALPPPLKASSYSSSDSDESDQKG